MIKYRQLLEQRKGAREMLLKNISEKEAVALKLNRKLRNIDTAIPIAQLVAQQTQTQIKYKITDLISLALADVFPDPYTFDLDFVPKRGKTDAVPLFTRRDLIIDPIEGAGLGPADVAAFAARISLKSIQKPPTRNTIVLDEPGKFISEDLQDKFAHMIKFLSDKLGIQFIIITHKPQITAVADKVFEVTKTQDISKVTVKEIENDV